MLYQDFGEAVSCYEMPWKGSSLHQVMHEWFCTVFFLSCTSCIFSHVDILKVAAWSLLSFSLCFRVCLLCTFKPATSSDQCISCDLCSFSRTNGDWVSNLIFSFFTFHSFSSCTWHKLLNKNIPVVSYFKIWSMYCACIFAVSVVGNVLYSKIVRALCEIKVAYNTTFSSR